jgi:glycosyltransferase involved in cell wall biosynthesis
MSVAEQNRSRLPACRVSVVIPCYNGERFLAESLASVLAQTYRDLEVIAVDDGSADRSKEVVLSFKDERVHLLEHDRNRGISATRNTGVRHARGEFVAFLDQDDLWYPEKLAKQVPILDAPNSDDVALVYTDRDILAGGKRYLNPYHRKHPVPRHDASTREVLTAFLRWNFVPLISVLLRRRCFDEAGMFNESIRSGVDDFELCVRLAIKGYRFVRVNEVLATRREHDENYSDPTRFLDDELAVLQQIVESHPTLEPLRRWRHADLLFQSARWWRLKGQLDRERLAYREALAVDPRALRSRVGLLLMHAGPLGDAAVSLSRFLRFDKKRFQDPR